MTKSSRPERLARLLTCAVLVAVVLLIWAVPTFAAMGDIPKTAPFGLFGDIVGKVVSFLLLIGLAYFIVVHVFASPPPKQAAKPSSRPAEHPPFCQCPRLQCRRALVAIEAELARQRIEPVHRWGCACDHQVCQRIRVWGRPYYDAPVSPEPAVRRTGRA